ncbi:MAG: glycerophosphodiester phosphodiesterase [Lautropia sp.]
MTMRRGPVDFDNWPYPRRCAHRGAGKLAPENTLAAFRVGAQHGYRMFEFDVKVSADGVPYLLHDATMPRTTSARGKAAGLDWAALSRIDAGAWHSPAWAGEPIPTLAAIERYLQANRFMADIEIKPVPGTERQTGAAIAAHCARSWLGSTARKANATVALLTSFSADALAAAHKEEPRLPRGLLLDKLPVDWLDRVRAHDCVALATNHEALSADIVAKAHANRLRVVAYTVNDLRRVNLLDRWGVDCIVTDAVDKIAFTVDGRAPVSGDGSPGGSPR